MSADTPSRTRRRVRKSDVVPSATHYVGYVQDEETPEMIMKKFEAMEQVIAATKSAAGGPQGAAEGAPSGAAGAEGAQAETQQLTEEQLQAVFKATSYFLPEHTLGDGFFGMEDVANDGDIQDEDEEGLDENEFFEDAREDGGKKRRKEKGEKTEKVKRQTGSHKLISQEITDTDGIAYLVVRKKIRLQDPEEPVYTRIPPAPVPSTWAALVTPFVPPELPAAAHSRVLEGDVLSYPLSMLGQFQGILMDPPLRSAKGPYIPGTITPAEFGKIHVTPKVIPNGLLFVWVEKEFIVDVVKQLRNWDFLYVENFVWVKKHVNNRFVTEDSAYFRRSKLSLHIFRRAVQEPIELRHQRTADVCFDFVRPLEGGGLDKPECVYQMIETLLPTATDPKTGKCNLLELWARRGRTRAGWTSLVHAPKEKPAAAAAST